MPGRLEFEFNAPRAGMQARRREDEPFRLLVVGPFGGEAGRPGALPLPQRRTHKVDLDTLDSVLARIAPQVTLSLAGNPTPITLTELDHLHPDALWQRVPAFRALHELRSRPLPAGADLLSGLLGGKGGAAATPAGRPAATGIDAFLQQVVAPHIVPDTRAEAAALERTIASAATAQMRELLRAGAFQQLEAPWRGLLWLLQSLELDDERLQLHLLDASASELLADVLAAQGQPARTTLHQLLVDRVKGVPGAAGFSLVVVLHEFGPSEHDIGLLAALGSVAAAAGCALLAGASAVLAGDPAAPALQGWQALRRTPLAPWVGLVAPRVLLRQPYGPRTDPVSAFTFEELDGGKPAPGTLLWGSGALAAALLLAQGQASGGRIDGLPAFSHNDSDGEAALQPVAEAALNEERAQALLQAGLMPLLAHRDAGAVTLLRLQSVAWPAQGLAGVAAR